MSAKPMYIDKGFPPKPTSINFGPMVPKIKSEFVPFHDAQSFPMGGPGLAKAEGSLPMVFKPVHPYYMGATKPPLMVHDPKITKLNKMIKLEKEKLKFKSKNKHAVWKNYKMFQKSINSKMKTFKFKSSKPSKKFFKTMEGKIKKMIVSKKESHKSVKTVKKQIKDSVPAKQRELFADLSGAKRRQKLSDLKAVLSRLAEQKYSDLDFHMTKSVFEQLMEGLRQFLECESDKTTRQAYSKLIRNLTLNYDSAKESVALRKCLSKT